MQLGRWITPSNGVLSQNLVRIIPCNRGLCKLLQQIFIISMEGKMYYLMHFFYSPISTVIYTRVLNRGGKGVRSPLDG